MGWRRTARSVSELDPLRVGSTFLNTIGNDGVRACLYFWMQVAYFYDSEVGNFYYGQVFPPLHATTWVCTVIVVGYQGVRGFNKLKQFRPDTSSWFSGLVSGTFNLRSWFFVVHWCVNCKRRSYRALEERGRVIKF